MYRPPNSTVELFNGYENLIEKLDSENKEIILIGDLNCDWTGVKSDTMKPQTNKLHEITEAFQLEQMIEQPTRITEHLETSKLKTSKSTGYDGIPNKLLKGASDIIAPSIIGTYI